MLGFISYWTAMTLWGLTAFYTVSYGWHSYLLKHKQAEFFVTRLSLSALNERAHRCHALAGLVLLWWLTTLSGEPRMGQLVAASGAVLYTVWYTVLYGVGWRNPEVLWLRVGGGLCLSLYPYL